MQSSPSEREVLRQISLPCVSTPADIFLVLRTLLNCLDCIIFWNCYKSDMVLFELIALKVPDWYNPYIDFV